MPLLHLRHLIESEKGEENEKKSVLIPYLGGLFRTAPIGGRSGQQSLDRENNL